MASIPNVLGQRVLSAVLDKLETGKAVDPRQKWGLVIYRCTYGDDSAWDTFITNFRAKISKYLEECGDIGHELWNELAWTIIDDREHFNHASKADVRKAFHEWVINQPVHFAGVPRYEFCIQVDDASLKSLVPDGFGVEAGKEPGFVNLIKRKWPDTPLASGTRGLYRKGCSDDEDNDEDQDEDEDEIEDEEPIEGCTEYDVGFMKATPVSIYSDKYMCITKFPFNWYHFYVRPPKVG